MSRQALKGIGQVIKANTTEKSIEALQAEGKKRVRVVSSERVMAIIQAIVDDTINSEVGEIAKRDRDRIVNDTQERFSHVLRMQQDLEQDMDDLRGTLREVELERDRLRGEKTILEAQLEVQRRADGDDDAVAKLARDVARLRETVERGAREPGGLDEAAVARLVERLTARDAQVSRRLDTEFEDLRTRIASAGREAATSSGEMAVRVSNAVLNGLDERDSAVNDGRSAAAAAETAQTAETLRRLQRSAEEARQAVLAEIGSLRGAVDDAKKRGADVQAEQLRGLEQRLASGASESSVALARTVERLAERMAALDGSIQAVRGELADAVDRAVKGGASASQADVAARVDGALAQLRGELSSLNARAVESAERQQEAVQAIRAQVAQNAAVQSGSLESTFKGALEQALDKITKTMERATARPIETSGEATDVLLAKMFDMPDVEMTSNLDQLDVEQRTTKVKISDSVGRLNEMNGRGKPGGK
jgi:hypothetical protein